MIEEQYNPSIKMLYAGILTVEDVRTHLDYIRQIEMALYNLHIDLQEQMASILPHDIKERYLNALHASRVDIKDSRGVQLFLADLKNKLKTIPVIGIVLAYLPTEKDLRNYSSFLFTNLGMQVVFDVRLEPALIGGCKIEFNGRIADYSIARTLATYMEKNQVTQS